eukprot:Phypoly_transcript_01440.p1 GENE.Phypoly_transcript_01440~~Phypoly_transcript_01440.p1  ORF type:complete len:1130 (-),score=207.03 Phypoly_transcript_01440:9-3374(-)
MDDQEEELRIGMCWCTQGGAFPVGRPNITWDEFASIISANSITHSLIGIEKEPVKLKKIAERVTYLLATQPSLVSTGFYECEFDDEGCRAIADEVAKWTSANTLCFAAKYSDEGVKILCNALEKAKVPQLYLTAPFADEGVKYLLEHLSEGRLKLTKISISDAKISRPTFQRLFQVLKYNKTITYFGLPDTNGDIQTIPHEWIEDCFSENSTLESLYSSHGIFAPVGWYAVRNKICNMLGAGKILRNSIPHHLTKDRDVRAFVTELMKSSEELRAMKLVVLGNGRIGKTTLLHAMQKILDPNFQQKPEDIESTVGIDCGSFNLANGHISVWDFAGQLEYTATHAFFLTVEMASILVCFNLGLSLDEQSQQITYWLDFLHSSLALPHLADSSKSLPKWNIIIVGVRSDEQQDFSLTQNAHVIKMWQKKYARLPIAPKIFTVSSLTSIPSVQVLLQYVEEQCSRIFEHHATQIPTSYKQFIQKLEALAKETQLIHWKDLYGKFGAEMGMKEKAFQTMLTYLQSIGRIVWLPNGTIFTDPTTAPKIAAKFISPKEVRLSLLKKESESVQILDETEIGCLLDINIGDNITLLNELELLVHLRICFVLHTADSDEVLYLFPSLSSTATKFHFSPGEKKSITGVRFVAPPGTIFVQGFICQLLVELFNTLNVYKADIQMVCENGAIIRCPGLFAGEMIVMTEFSHKTLIIAMNASDPDTDYAVAVFNELVQNSFAQYSGSKKEDLCAECLADCFLHGKGDPESVGIFQKSFLVCSTNQHSAPAVDTQHQREKCKAHDKDHHHIFLNYRVKSEGRRSPLSSAEKDGGAVEHMFQALAVKKTKLGQPLFVFWDCKCLNDGQNWELGFMHGLQQSRVIVLLMSNTTMQGILSNAQNMQDNVLIEYESALLLNKLYRVPVFPVFLAEMGIQSQLVPFSFNLKFPDVPHKRNESSQRFIDNISQHLPPQSTKFLESIKSTMAEIFMLQGAFMEHRVEDASEVQVLVDRILNILDKAPPLSPLVHQPMLLSPAPSPQITRPLPESFSLDARSPASGSAPPPDLSLSPPPSPAIPLSPTSSPSPPPSSTPSSSTPPSSPPPSLPLSPLSRLAVSATLAAGAGAVAWALMRKRRK